MMQNRLLVISIIAVVAAAAVVGIRVLSMTGRSAGEIKTATNAAMLATNNPTQITAESITYAEGTQGFYARPQAAGDYPGVVMVHEWWGLNDQIKDMAQTLAKEGYQALAVDLYDGKVAQTAEEARAQTQGLNQEAATNKLIAATKYLRETKGAPKVGTLGWCFGGGQAMQLSVSGQPLDATVIYYGQLVTDKVKLAAIKWPVLGIFGDKDQSIPVDTVNAFDDVLNELDIEHSIVIFPNVGHAFANPTGQSYAPEETKEAWARTLRFLSQNLKES